MSNIVGPIMFDKCIIRFYRLKSLRLEIIDWISNVISEHPNKKLQLYIMHKLGYLFKISSYCIDSQCSRC